MDKLGQTEIAQNLLGISPMGAQLSAQADWGLALVLRFPALRLAVILVRQLRRWQECETLGPTTASQGIQI